MRKCHRWPGNNNIFLKTSLAIPQRLTKREKEGSSSFHCSSLTLWGRMDKGTTESLTVNAHTICYGYPEMELKQMSFGLCKMTGE